MRMILLVGFFILLAGCGGSSEDAGQKSSKANRSSDDKADVSTPQGA